MSRRERNQVSGRIPLTLLWALVFAFLLATPSTPAAAQPPPWCPQDPAVPYPAPTWAEIGDTPDYETVSSNLNLAKSLRLLTSVLEKALARLQGGPTLAGVNDIDGTCLCNCNQSAGDLTNVVLEALQEELPSALREGRDAYLKSVIDAMEQALAVIEDTDFHDQIAQVLADECRQAPSVCSPGSALDDAINAAFDSQIPDLSSLVDTTALRNLATRIDALATDVEALAQSDPGLVELLTEVPPLVSEARSIGRDIQSQLEQLRDDARDLASDFRSQSVDDRVQQALEHFESWLDQHVTVTPSVRSDLEQILRERVDALTDTAQQLAAAIQNYEDAFDVFQTQILAALEDRLTNVEGCFGVTKKGACSLQQFCSGTQAGQLLGEDYPIWLPTEVFQDGGSERHWALNVIVWLDQARQALDNASAPALPGRSDKPRLIEVLENGQELLDRFERYVDHFSDGYHLGALSDIRPDLHMCVGYAGHGTLAELFSTSIGNKSVRGGSSYLSANLSKEHRAQFRAGGFTLQINEKRLPLAPGLSLNLQMDGFRLWDRRSIFGLGSPDPMETFNSSAIEDVDVFNLVDEQQLCDIVGEEVPPSCHLSLVDAFYKPFFPIEYSSGGPREWPRPDIDWEEKHRLSAVLGAGLNLPFPADGEPTRGQQFFELKTLRWDGPQFLLFPGATLKTSLTLDSGFGWLYQSNFLRGSLLENLNENAPNTFALDDFARLTQPLQAPDVTEDVGHAAHVNPTVNAGLLLGIRLSRRFEVGITASLHVGVDVEVGGYGGILDLKRPFFDAFAESNPDPGNDGQLDCRAVIEDNETRVCSNTFFSEPEPCGEDETCLGSDAQFEGSYSVGEYVCETGEDRASEDGDGIACGERGYCVFSGRYVIHDVVREECRRVQPIAPEPGEPTGPTARDQRENRVVPGFPEPVFHAYQCQTRREPEVVGWEGPECHPLLVGFDADKAQEVRDELDQPGTSYVVASYALNRTIVSVLLGWSAEIGLRYKLFRNWKSRELWSAGDTIPLVELPLVSAQVGLEAPYFDDCSTPSPNGTVVNHQPLLVQRVAGGGTAFDLVDRCRPLMEEDVQNPQSPPDDVGGLATGAATDLETFAQELAAEYWQQGQLCIEGERLDVFFENLQLAPQPIWSYAQCGYRTGSRILDLECPNAETLERSLAEASGCLDVDRPANTPLRRALGNELGLWTRQLTPTVAGQPAGPRRTVFDLGRLFNQNGPDDLFTVSNVNPNIRTSLGSDFQPWLNALVACTNDLDDRLELSLDIGDPEPCGGACCEGGSCTQVDDPAACSGSFSAGQTCDQVEPCATPPTVTAGACVTSGGCSSVADGALCQGAFEAGATCGTTDLCFSDEQCESNEWCPRPQGPILDPTVPDRPTSSTAPGRCRLLLAVGSRCDGLRPELSSDRCQEGLSCVFGRRSSPTEPFGPPTCQPVCASWPKGMTAWWPLDETLSQRTPDALGRRSARLQSNPAQIDGRVGRALSFDGRDDRLVIADGASVRFGRYDLSIAFWIRTEDLSANRPVLSKRRGRAGYRLHIDRGRPALVLADDSGASRFRSGTNIADGAWHLVAVTVDRDQPDGVRWYVDGRPVGMPGNPTARSGPLDDGVALIVAANRRRTQFLRAGVDEIVLVRGVLGEREILRLFRAGQEGICRCAGGLGPAPAAWWKFDRGPLRVFDEIGTAHGVSTGRVRSEPGQVGTALAFDGQDDHVDVPDQAALDVGSGDFSLEGWIRHRGASGSVGSVVDKRLEEQRGFNLFVYRGRLGLQLSLGQPQYRNFVSQVDLSDGAWHHVAVTVDRDQPDGLRWYVDGQPLGPAQNPTAFAGDLDNAAVLRMGAIGTSSPRLYWHGALDELSLYRRALAAWEVERIADAAELGKCRDGS